MLEFFSGTIVTIQNTKNYEKCQNSIKLIADNLDDI